MFQFTPLREGRRLSAFNLRFKESFNSRPCVRGDIWVFVLKCLVKVSIHAPA